MQIILLRTARAFQLANKLKAQDLMYGQAVAGTEDL
jgi:hypothetical protein